MLLSTSMTQKSNYVPSSWLNPLNLSLPDIKSCYCGAVAKGSVSSLRTQEKVNEAALKEDIDKTWEVLAEPIQTVMRRYSVPEPYEKLKELTRGRAVNKESIREFIQKLDIPVDAKTFS